MGLYLQGADLTTFGVPGASGPQIQQASLLIDAYVARPEGLTYTGQVMDNTGAPIVETKRSPKRPGYAIMLSRPNVAQVLSVQQSWLGVPNWQALTDFSFLDGEGLWVSGAHLGAQLQITYLAGWLYANLPARIKQACANIIGTISAYPDLSGNIQSLKAGDTAITRFKDTVLDADTKRMLSPYCRVMA